MNRNAEAVKCFDESLEINAFQSHVFYRRGLTYYNMGEYNLAMKDVTNAFNLGLDDEDLRELRNKLVKKFDMGM